MRTLAIFTTLIILLVSCSENINRPNDYDNIERIKIGDTPNNVSLTFETDTIKIDGYHTSLLGKWITLNNTLAFLDASIVPINIFDTTGKFIRSIFDIGRGPKELTSPAFAYIKLTDNRYFYSNLSQKFKLIDSCNNIIENKSFLQMMFNADSISMDIIYNNPNYSMKSIYEINFTEPIHFNNYIIHPITTEHMKYNGYFKKNRADDFYKNSYTMASISYNNDSIKVEKYFGQFPPIYRNTIIPNFKNNHLTSDCNNLYVSYEADPNIYVYNKDFKLLGYIGEPVKEISTVFPKTTTVEEAEDNYNDHKLKCGYYYKINFINGYLFRNYVKPNKVNGIQIYKNGYLVYENDFDKEFNVVGYIEPYYYAHIETDIEDELFKIVRFKIN